MLFRSAPPATPPAEVEIPEKLAEKPLEEEKKAIVKEIEIEAPFITEEKPFIETLTKEGLLAAVGMMPWTSKIILIFVGIVIVGLIILSLLRKRKMRKLPY